LEQKPGTSRLQLWWFARATQATRINTWLTFWTHSSWSHAGRSFEGIYATCLTSFGKALSLGFGGAGHCDMFKKLNCCTLLLHRYGQSLEHLHGFFKGNSKVLEVSARDFTPAFT